MRAARIAWTVAGTWMACDRLRQPIRVPLPRQRLRLHQRSDALLEEEGVPVGPLDQQSLEGLKSGVIPEQGSQQLFGALRWQGVDPQLPVVASCRSRRADTRAGS